MFFNKYFFTNHWIREVMESSPCAISVSIDLCTMRFLNQHNSSLSIQHVLLAISIRGGVRAMCLSANFLKCNFKKCNFKSLDF